MKKLGIILTLILLSTASALARNATPSATPWRWEQIEQKREEARERLQLIRDENKQKIAERINQQLEHIQDQAVKHFNNVIERLNKLLNKIKTRVPAADTSAAQAAITAAQTAVDDLADNVYTIEFTAESGLRIGASAAKTKLRSDIKAVHEKIILARQAVADALKAAKEL